MQGREPAKSILELAVEEAEALIETQGQSGAPEVTTGDPVNVPPAEQNAAGGVEQLPNVPSDTPSEPPTRGKRGG